MDVRRNLWLWFQNLDGAWREFIDFAAQWKVDAITIWFPFSYMEEMTEDWTWPPRKGVFGSFGREVVEYAHSQGVQFICGFPLNGYDVGAFVLRAHPELQAVIPPELANTPKGKESVGHIFCPSNDLSQRMMQELLNILVEKTGVDGFNFESGAVDYVTCHCPRCTERFRSQSETESENKPVLWEIEQINSAVDFLKNKHENLCLSMNAIYGQVTDPEMLAKSIDERCTMIWGDWGNFPNIATAERLMNVRQNTGFLLRLHQLREPHPQCLNDIIESCGDLISFHPKEMVGRAWIPKGWNAVKDALFAEATRNPHRSSDEWDKRIARLESLYPFEKEADEVPEGDYNEIKGEWGFVNIV